MEPCKQTNFLPHPSQIWFLHLPFTEALIWVLQSANPQRVEVEIVCREKLHTKKKKTTLQPLQQNPSSKKRKSFSSQNVGPSRKGFFTNGSLMDIHLQMTNVAVEKTNHLKMYRLVNMLIFQLAKWSSSSNALSRPTTSKKTSSPFAFSSEYTPFHNRPPRWRIPCAETWKSWPVNLPPNVPHPRVYITRPC